jgi:hypothetical protein
MATSEEPDCKVHAHVEISGTTLERAMMVLGKEQSGLHGSRNLKRSGWVLLRNPARHALGGKR